MILYHGTPLKSGKKIIETGVIKHDCKRVWNSDDLMIMSDGKIESLETTDGFVYMSDKLSLATFYGNSARIRREEDDDWIYIFRVELSLNELQQDADELKMNYRIVNSKLSAQESLNICHCVTVDHSLSRNEYKIEYIKYPIRNFSHNYELKTLVEEINRNKSKKEADPSEVLNKLEVQIPWKSL